MPKKILFLGGGGFGFFLGGECRFIFMRVRILLNHCEAVSNGARPICLTCGVAEIWLYKSGFVKHFLGAASIRHLM